MSFSTHTFEVNVKNENKGFAFHESLGEGQELYFLGKFDNDENSQNIAETIFGGIVDAMQKSSITDAYDKFEEALKQTNSEIEKLRNKFSKIPDIVLAYFDFNNLYLTQSGEAESYLIRENSMSQISESNENKNDFFVNILSGQVNIGDVVAISSSRILRFITSSQLVETLSSSDFDQSSSLLRHYLTNNSEEDLLVTLVGIGKESKNNETGFLSKIVSKISDNNDKKIEMETETTEDLDKNTLPFSDNQADHEESIPNDFPKNTKFENIKTNPMNKLFQKFREIKFLQKMDPKSLKLIGGVVLISIVIGITIRFISNYESAEEGVMRQELNTAKTALQQADIFLVQGDRVQAKELISQAQTAAQKILNSDSKNFRFDAQTLLADIQEKQLAVENARKVEPQLLADLGVRNDNINSMGILNLRGSLYAYDTKQYYKTVRNIVEKGVTVSDKESIIDASAKTDQNTLVFLTDGPRIWESKGGVLTSMSTNDEAWKKGSDIESYNRYIYVLDPVENQIWKYQRRSSSYSEADAYNQGADLSRSVSFTIDGSIFILSDDGNIQKLFRGAKSDYEFRDIPSIPFSGKKLRIFTTTNLNFLYILDPDNSRILIFDKKERFAIYKKQVIFNKITDAVDFIIDDSGQKANIITTDKIYELPL